MSDVTRLLDAAAGGDLRAPTELLPLVYDELRKLAAARMAVEPAGQTLQPTALVHEAYLRLVGGRPPDGWDSPGHFFAAAAEAMRRILVEHARHKGSRKAGGGRRRVDLADAEPAGPEPDLDLAALDQLGRLDARKAHVVKLRFFAGLTGEQAARALGIATSTADADWAFARCWLRLEMGGPG